jgi:hypothetical protein
MLRLTVLLLAMAIAQATVAAPAAFGLASKTGDEWGGTFRWEANGLTASVSAAGALKLSGTVVDQQRPVRFPLEKTEWISRLSLLQREESLFLAFDTDDGDSGRGVLCRIAIKSSSILWCRSVPGFNMFGAIAHDGAIFVGAIGFLGRIDPKSGRFLWKHPGLYNKDKTFNIFCAPEEEGGRISMYGTTGVPSTTGKRVTLDRQTGRIISITEAELPGGCH